MTLIPSSNHIISESDTKKEHEKHQTIGNMTKIVYFVINNTYCCLHLKHLID